MKPRGVRIRWLLLGSSSVILLVPLVAVVALRIYDTYLVRQTERQLIAQAVVVGELWREAWLQERGVTTVPPFRPPDRADDAFIPIEPRASVRQTGVAARQVTDLPAATITDTPERRAGARIAPVLQRMQVFNLSAVRVLDTDGCVVATSRGEGDRCMGSLPEVQQALAGHYNSILRERISDEPLPPVSDVRSRGSIRIFTALPIFSDGKVVGVVRMSRTSLDALTSLWNDRRGLLVMLLVSGLAVVLCSIGFSAWIARPVQAITRRAEAVAQGGPYEPIRSGRWTPYEIQQLGAALDTMAGRLQGRAEYVAELAANVSHELKSPITAIRGAAELLRDQWQEMDEPQRQRFIENIDADATRMERLVSRLLELARIENAPAALEEVQVREFFQRLVDRYGARVQLRLDDPPGTIAMLPDHLAMATLNLVENALRYGGATPVELRVGTEGKRLRIEVRDHGPGISEANQKRLFQRFFTTDREHGGTGLGLSIVKAVADTRGGSVRYETGPEGTTFVVVM